ncbi:phosphonate C-P lyase system protein PhnH [Mesorhizobium australicum]|uniref:Alpha-D-ribose 1-methylphosphonate 5-triphosphate synthase subunit PhnH n=1 Tax=Mesorhizobium australicum TaxID=536018 RepID=A0A1X7PNT7_9HYPH|nr:phosphonate C-P lyase system protein PhnH [Mesorhizobium australicum]SMH52816.1 alpha-D-ribose 1-methylphosphonate 5-triphosphate synthase subunit PhnH [Mesorhizobium australicum]
MPTTAVIQGGFRAPVFDAQSVFRAVMDAMARPGSRRSVTALTLPPAPMSPLAGAVALALCDHDTPVWLDRQLLSVDVRNWLGFHSGAPVTSIATEAHFAFAAAPDELVALESFAQGSQDYPDRSTTIVLQVESFDSGPPLVLTGPGIRTTATVAPSPMPRHFSAQWRQNGARFPRGVDLILVSGGEIVCLPRTTRIADGQAGG